MRPDRERPARPSVGESRASAPRRVLYVVNDLALGGAQRVLFHQSTFLDPARYTVEVASFEFDSSGTLVHEFERAGIPIHRLRRASEWRLAGASRLPALIARFRPDLVHTHLAAAGVLGRLAARRAGVARVVTTLHNLSDWEEKRGGALRWLDRRTLDLADTVIAVSDAVRDAFARGCPRLAARAVTVRNGVPLSEMIGPAGDRDVARAALGYGPEDFVVGAVARLEPRKGLDTLIEAVALAAPRATRLRVLLVGDGPERDRLAALAAARGVANRICFAGHQSPVRGHLAAMDLFAAPSRTEGLGIAIIEALAAGVPVLGARVGGIPEVVVDGSCGALLAVGRADEWAEALLRCAADRDGLTAWGRAARARAREFSLEASGRSLEGIYDALLGARSSGAPLAAAA